MQNDLCEPVLSLRMYAKPTGKSETSYKAPTEISSRSFVFLLGRLNATD